jgi:hypothetical protein
MVGFKVLQNFYANCGESVQPLQSVKLIDLLTVKSSLDPHMINEHKDGIILLSGYSCGLAKYQP